MSRTGPMLSNSCHVCRHAIALYAKQMRACVVESVCPSAVCNSHGV